ncbi:MAG: hypothetical protein IKB14_07430, partial [Rikenellaceae bacterium]|nr:hypothetical protein [Rikenellaceae bacterium]
PIPNREVKLTNADGTAYLSGRVGSRLFKEQIERFAPFFVDISVVGYTYIYYIYENPDLYIEIGVGCCAGTTGVLQFCGINLR